MMVCIARTGRKVSFGGTGDAFGDPGWIQVASYIRRELREQSLVGEIKPNRNVVQRTHQLFTDLFELIVSYSWH